MKNIIPFLLILILFLISSSCSELIKVPESQDKKEMPNINQTLSINESLNENNSYTNLSDSINLSGKSCLVDEDCIKVCLDCCTCNNGVESYNKKYITELGINPQGNCTGIMTTGGCPVSKGGTYPICENNTCILIPVGSCETKEDCVSWKDYGCVNKNFCNRANDCKPDNEYNCVYCNEGACSDNQ